MALTSVYYDGPVTETDRAQNLAGAPEYGVYGPEDFKVTAHPSIANAVIVKAGRAHGHGVTDTADIDQIVNCTPLSVGQIRWDLVVVRRNWQPALGGPSTLAVLQAGATATIPAQRKVGPGVEDDQPLAFIKWQGGTSAPIEFIDLRVWQANGGTVGAHDLVRSYLNTVGTRIWINGIDWIRRLVANDTPEWVDVNRGAYTTAAGSVAIGGVGAGGSAGPFLQSFPAGRFNVAPIVTVNTDQTRLIAVAADVTKDGFNLYMTNWSGGSSGSAGQMRWVATQMTPTSAAG
jgi:hypothetical protein